MLIKVMGTVADVHESGIDFIALQAGVVLEGLGTKVVLRDATMFAELRTSALEHQNITPSHSGWGKARKMVTWLRKWTNLSSKYIGEAHSSERSTMRGRLE